MTATILVQINKVNANLPLANAAFAGTKITVTDSAGAAQTATVVGTETPPWSASFSDVAVGVVAIVATDLDAKGETIGTPITQNFTTNAPTQFPQTSGITVTQTA